MITEFSPPYRVVQSSAGFTVMNSMGGYEVTLGNRGEAEEIARMMNQQSSFREFLLSTAKEPNHVTQTL